jgi:YspA, cpYpsA-related SLOG family
MTFKEVPKVARYAGTRTICLVTGDRYWTDRDLILRALRTLPDHTVIIHGNASGADSLADLAAAELGLPRAQVPYFGCFHRAGGPIRNTFMLHVVCGLRDQGWTVEVLAFHDDLAHSRGTRDMVIKAKDAGLRVRRVRHKKGEE